MNGLEWSQPLDWCWQAKKFCPGLLLFTVAEADANPNGSRWRLDVVYEGIDEATDCTGLPLSTAAEAMHAADKKWAAIQAGITLVILQNTSWEEEPW